ncbi:MAG: alpha/beta hydrolase [Bacteroidota bacterium]
MKIYAISGLGADERVFSYLELQGELIALQWLKPRTNEPLESYALRMAEKVNQAEPFALLGVSFGGLVAVEMSKVLQPNLTILISSVETKDELSTVYRLLGKTKLVKWIPYPLFDPPRMLASWVFGAKRKALLNEILNDTDLKFAKWAVNALLTWQNTTKLTTPLLKIGGTNDKLLPPQGNTILIENGAHFMIVDRAEEISQIINERLEY